MNVIKWMKTLGISACCLAFCVSCDSFSQASLTEEDKEFIEARDIFNSGKTKEAITKLSALIKHHPSYAGGYLCRGDCHQELEEYDAAVNDYTEALDLYKSGIRSYPANSDLTKDALYERAVCNNARHHYKESLEDLNVLRSDQIPSILATHWILRAEDELALKDYKAANQDLQSAEKMFASGQPIPKGLDNNEDIESFRKLSIRDQISVAELRVKVAEAAADKAGLLTAKANYKRLRDANPELADDEEAENQDKAKSADPKAEAKESKQ